MFFNFSGIDHIQLAAPEGCESEARNFFAELLGWKEIPKPELKKTWWCLVSMWNSPGPHWSSKGFCPRYKSPPRISCAEYRFIASIFTPKEYPSN
jgi:hypothetical protein